MSPANTSPANTSTAPTVDEALVRLDAALTRLETRVARRVEADAAPDDRDTELALLEADRARLAAELDAAGARLAAVTATAGEVGQRLDRAIAAVEGALADTPDPAARDSGPYNPALPDPA